MSAAPSYLSLEQFEQSYEGRKPHYEYWFGEAIQKQMPTSLHGFLQFAITLLLRRNGWKAGPEIRLKISKVAHPVPDVVASLSPMENPYPTQPLDLCVEILSPRDKLPAVFKKAAHYLDWGIKTVWIVDAQERKGYIMTLERPEPVEISLSGHLVAGTGDRMVRLSLGEIFAEAEQDLA